MQFSSTRLKDKAAHAKVQAIRAYSEKGILFFLNIPRKQKKRSNLFQSLRYK
jgi:hypothetical protein